MPDGGRRHGRACGRGNDGRRRSARRPSRCRRPPASGRARTACRGCPSCGRHPPAGRSRSGRPRAAPRSARRAPPRGSWPTRNGRYGRGSAGSSRSSRPAWPRPPSAGRRSPPGSMNAPRIVLVHQIRQQFCCSGVTGMIAALRGGRVAMRRKWLCTALDTSPYTPGKVLALGAALLVSVGNRPPDNSFG